MTVTLTFARFSQLNTIELISTNNIDLVDFVMNLTQICDANDIKSTRTFSSVIRLPLFSYH